MADFDSDEEDGSHEKSVGRGGFYKRFSRPDSRSNSFSFLPPVSTDNEENIFDIKQPSLSSANLTDSVCSNSTISSNCNSYKFYQDVQHNVDNPIKNEVNTILDNDMTFVQDVVHDSEPEDMQNIEFTKKNCLNQTDILKKVYESGDKNDKKCLISKNLDRISIDYSKLFSSTPISSLCLSKEMRSFSLQDVSTIDIFPLHSKTNNAFSTETIQTQSMSSTTKSKDSGFQRSASCLSLNSGNRSYDHIQSKVKQYIKDIKEAEAQRKKQKFKLQGNTSLEETKSPIENSDPNINMDCDLSESRGMIKTINLLKGEIKEKDTILNELQQKYNSLLSKYAEAINQIDLLRLRSSLNYDYPSDPSDITISNYNNESNSSLFIGCNRKESSISISNKTNSIDSLSSKRFDDLFTQNMSVFNSNKIDNNCDVSIHLDRISGPKLQPCDISIKDESFESNSKDLCITQSIQNNNINLSGGLNENMITRPQQITSSSQSTSINTAASIKSVMLGPISRMYSSSSRLDKKVSPLPTSCSPTGVFKLNSSKNKNVSVVTNNFDYNNKDRNDSFDRDSNNFSMENDGNSKEVYYKSSSGLIGDTDSSVPYLNCQSISRLELPKVDPFDKVKKWQASLPTISLVRSQSSSSIGSAENIETKSHACRYSSLESKLDHENFYQNGLFESQPDKAKPKESKEKLRLDFDDCDDSSHFVSKHEQNTISCPKYVRIYSDFYDSNKPTVIRTKHQSKNAIDQDKGSKNILQRSNALDYNEDCIEDESCSGNGEVYNRKVDSLPFIKKGEDLPSLGDESSSMSSSILSSSKDKDRFTNKVKNFDKLSLLNNKNINNQEVINKNDRSGQKKQWYKGSSFPNETNIDVVCKTQNGSGKDSGTNIQRFSLSAQFRLSSEGDSVDIPVFQKLNAWDSPKRVIDTKMINKPSKKSKEKFTTQQLVIGNQSSQNNSNVQQNGKRKERLKHYTEILRNKKNSDGDELKSFVSVGIQAPDEFSEVNMNELTTGRAQQPSRTKTYDQNLDDADEYVKYIIQEVKKIHSHLERLQTSVIKNDEHYS